MAQQFFANGDTGAEVRGIIDDNFAELYVVQPMLYSYNSSDTTNSIAHQQATVGQMFLSAYADSNKIGGSATLWECINTTAGTASDTLTISSTRAVMQGTYGQFAMRVADANLSQFFVNTNAGTAQQSKIHLARDWVIANSNKRRLKAFGSYEVSDTINLRHINADLECFEFTEPSAGLNDELVQVGDAEKTYSLSDPQNMTLTVKGINVAPNAGNGEYDFQGTQSQATGVMVREADSAMTYAIKARRLYIGVRALGNTEQNRFSLDARYCHIALKEDGPSTSPTDSGTPDTVKWTMVGKSCKQWYLSGADTSTWVDFACHDRTDDGTTMASAWDAGTLIPKPAIFISNGKRQILTGFMRGHNGRTMIYIDRSTSTSKSGSGTDTVDLGIHTTHTYGEVLLVDRVSQVQGLGMFLKDNGPARSNFAASDSISCATVRLNRVDKLYSLPLSLSDIYSDFGVVIGDATKDLYPTDIVFNAPISILMRAGAGTYSFKIEKAVRCVFPMLTVNKDIYLDAGCTDCHLRLSTDFIEKGLSVTKHASATASVYFYGSLASADLPATAWVGMTVESLSDYDGRPAFYDGTAWKVATTEAL